MTDSALRTNLRKLYTVEFIMTPYESLTFWDLEGLNASCITDDGKLKFDVIPVKKDGQITGVKTALSDGKIQPLKMDWLITHDMPISELVELFVSTQKPGFLVYKYHDIIGIVTPADLNKLPARTYIYTLIGDVELKLSELIRSEPELNEGKILTTISKARSRNIKCRINKMLEQNVDVDIIELLYLSDMLTIIKKTESLRKSLGFTSMNQVKQGLSGINDLRTCTMHLVKPLLEKMPGGLIILNKRLQRIHRILNSPILKVD